ncbi:DUF3347 domain-containing protein [Daejeonella sp.]|uniref:DUF3347 domain-containing protein n=1 Tax=Daejeonella sp. TaxID=2805397 RepID=UPI0030C3D16B
MNLRLVISGLVIAGMFTACNQTGETKDAKAVDSTAVGSAPAADLKDDKTQEVYNDYLKLKDVLVSSDAAGAQAAGKELATSLANVQGCENTASLANKIAAAGDLKTQRVHFTALSSDIVALLKHTDVNSGAMYVMHCPMINEGKGGYWLAAEKEVRNPYYGDEMLNCGSVKETIGAGKN